MPERRDLAVTATVMATVNAPYRIQLEARELAHGLLDHAAAKNIPGHMSGFLGEVSPSLQLEFARLFGITDAQLIAAAKAFAAYSGETYPWAK
jgi:hypothetical protein